MKHYIKRAISEQLQRRMKQFPVVAILGPRQCGKSTLARKYIEGIPNALYLDLEMPSHVRQLNDPEAFFRFNQNKLLCLDEIQRLPNIFTIIRSVVDITKAPGQFLVLGSASPELLKQSAESLAGRIAYLDLTPFICSEVSDSDFYKHWLRGGFPDSFLADDDEHSIVWRENFIRTYLEQDIPNLGISISSQTIHRLWTMLAHISGQILNMSKLADALGVSSPTVKSYLDILEKTYMLRVLRPLHANVKKSLVKSPKVFLRDTGVLHALLQISSMNELFGHPSVGNSFESWAIEQICTLMPDWTPYFYRTSKGAEIDLVLEKGTRKIAIECKASTAPKATRGLHNAISDLNIEKTFIVAPLTETVTYPYAERIQVTTVHQLPERIKSS